MRAFVTGATGFVGTNLIQELDKAGWEIIALCRPTSDLSELKKCKKVIYAPGDIMDIESLRRGMPPGVDAVFHVAGSVGPVGHGKESSRYDINQTGTRNVVTVALEKKIGRFIHTSTVLTYDFESKKSFDETAPPVKPSTDAYIGSKRLADVEVEAGVKAGLDAVFIHPSAIFGAYDKVTWSKMFMEIERGLPLPFAPPGGGSVCHCRKVAAAHISAFHKGTRGGHYILGGPDENWLNVAIQVAKILKRPAPKWRLPTPLFMLYGYVEYWVSRMLGRAPTLDPHSAYTLCINVFSDSSRAIRELGYQPSTLDEMLQDCYQWMVATGMIKRP
ncbi:MAG: NAD-dependent epimerase/dehydratase family protein [Bdellovibrionales bacterium]|nr:NAD-dependent epimerase/dehydratase family protein [Bdellovibrionales bacterium]